MLISPRSNTHKPTTTTNTPLNTTLATIPLPLQGLRSTEGDSSQWQPCPASVPYSFAPGVNYHHGDCGLFRLFWGESKQPRQTLKGNAPFPTSPFSRGSHWLRRSSHVPFRPVSTAHEVFLKHYRLFLCTFHPWLNHTLLLSSLSICFFAGQQEFGIVHDGKKVKNHFNLMIYFSLVPAPLGL